MEGLQVIGAVAWKMKWLWMPPLFLLIVSETKTGKKVLDKLTSIIYN